MPAERPIALPDESFDVVIAGGGPVGLFLACELRLAGLSVLVLEQVEDAGSPFKQLPFGMRGLSAATLDALDRRGLLDAVAPPLRPHEAAGPRGAPPAAHWAQQVRRPGGHFAGIQFFEDDIDVASWTYRLPTPGGTSMAVTMADLEAALAARAIASGVDIRRGIGVEGFGQSADDVIVRAGSGTFVARWLVGCDGGRSTVRKEAGFAFTGTDPEFTGYSVQVGLQDADGLMPGRHYTPTGMYTYQEPGTIAMVDFDGGAAHRSGPITREHVQAVLRRVSGTQAVVDVLDAATTWTDRAHGATTYRDGRVLLAGDAAHIHSPLGGQGLNLGLGDAMNLGWKLAAQIHGDAPASLLDSYASERRPVAAKVLDWSRAQVALMRPSHGSRALAAIVRDLVATRDGATYFADRVRAVSLRHDVGDDHPLAGRSVPDFASSDGTRVAERMRNGKGLLLDFDPRGPVRSMAAHWAHRVTYVAGDARDPLGLSAVLVRPDGIVAWVAEGVPDEESLERAAARWFGERR